VPDASCVDATPTRAQLSSPCPEVQLTVVDVQVVTVAMDLPAAIKFDDLMANPTVMQDLKANVAQSFATAAGVHVGYVTVSFERKTSRRLDARKSSLRRLTADGVKANAQIVAPQGQSVTDVSTAITGAASTLASDVVQAVLDTPNIESAAPGETITSLRAARNSMITAAQTSYNSYGGPQVAVVSMTLDSNSALATAVASNTVTTTTTTVATATVGATTTTTAAPTTNATTTLPSEGVLGGSRTLAAMTVSTAAAVFIAVSA